MKKCTKCLIEKDENEFGKDKYMNGGLRNKCKLCILEKDRLYRASHRKEINAHSRKIRASNPEKYRIAARERYKANPDKAKAYSKCWRSDNPDKVKALRKKQAPMFKDYQRKFRLTFKGKIRNWKDSAKRRHITWNLNLSMLEAIPLVCYYTGKQLTLEQNQPNTVSLDRLDSSKGYEIDNIVLCCETINRMKWEFTLAEFIDICKKITDNYGKPIINGFKYIPQIKLKNSSKFSARFQAVKYRANRLHREFNLDYSEISNRPFNCFYTGIPLTCETNKMNTVSFDRLDSFIGYTSSNTVLCCHYVNLMKQEMTLQDFLDTCKIISCL